MVELCSREFTDLRVIQKHSDKQPDLHFEDTIFTLYLQYCFKNDYYNQSLYNKLITHSDITKKYYFGFDLYELTNNIIEDDIYDHEPLCFPYEDISTEYIKDNYFEAETSIYQYIIANGNFGQIIDAFNNCPTEQLYYDGFITDLFLNNDKFNTPEYNNTGSLISYDFKKKENVACLIALLNIFFSKESAIESGIMDDIKGQMLIELSSINFTLYYYHRIYEYIIEKGGNVNYRNGKALKNLLSQILNTKNKNVDYLHITRLFLDNGYNINSDELYNTYLLSKNTDKDILELISVKNTNTTKIFISSDCCICFEDFNTLTDCKKLALNTCGHMMCSNCYEGQTRVKKECPKCRAEYSNGFEIVF